MNYIDSHFHLDYYRNFKELYNYINESKQYTLCVTNSPEVFYSCISMFSETKYLKFALGYNPKCITKNKFNKKLFNYLVGQTKYIGEVGLDFTGKLKQNEKKQISVFDYICSTISKNQILSVHSKNAEKAVLETLRKNHIQKAILHWYSGNISTLQELLAEGYYFSINSNMLTSSKGISIIRNIPKERILIESDGPFTKIDSKIYTPPDLPILYQQLSELLECENIDSIIWNNFKNLVS